MKRIGQPAMTVLGALSNRAKDTPHSTAYLWEVSGRTVSVDWERHASLITLVAQVLANKGVQPDSIVIVKLSSQYHWELVDKALMALGASIISVSTKRSFENQRKMIESVQATHIIHEAVEDLLFATELQNVSCVSCVWDVDSGQLQIQGEQIGIFDSPIVAGNFFSDTHALALTLSTSGTTGEPKLLPYTHAQVFEAVRTLHETFFDDSVSSSLRGLSWLPLENAFQRLFNACAYLTGAETYFIDDPRDIVEKLPVCKPSFLIGVPSFYKQLMQKAIDASEGASPEDIRASFKKISGGALQYMLVGSAPLQNSIIEFFQIIGIPFFEGYGLSESIKLIAANRLEDSRPGSVGKVLPGNVVSISEEGELLVSGPGVCEGMKSAKDGLLHTGDIGRMDAEGFLYLTGRSDEIVKTANGKKISIIPLEQRIQQKTHAQDVVIFGHGRSKLIGLLSFEQAIGAEQRLDLQRGLQQLNANAYPEERINGWLILSRPLQVEAGELTPTFKKRRKAIEQKFAKALDGLSQELQASKHPEVVTCQL